MQLKEQGTNTYLVQTRCETVNRSSGSEKNEFCSNRDSPTLHKFLQMKMVNEFLNQLLSVKFHFL